MKDFSKYLISKNATIIDALEILNNLSSDILTLFVIDEDMHLLGTITDGDIRRGLLSGKKLDDNIIQCCPNTFLSFDKSNLTIAQIKKIRNLGVSLIPFLDENNRIIKVYNFKRIKSILPIDAVLMAGGRGERLRPMTDSTPKPLLKVGDKPIIDYNIDRLRLFGIENIYITVNYLAEQIEEHFSKENDFTSVECIKEPKFLGTIGSIKFIPEFKHDTILVMNSDLFTNIDLEDFYDDFINSDADMAIAAIPYSVNVPYGIFELNDDTITGINEKPTYNYYANGGIYLIKRKLLELIPSNTFFNATDFTVLLIENNYKVIRFPIIGYWIDIGKPEDYKKVQEFVKHIKA